MSSDEDYMSDSFLKSITTSTDVRPGLTHSHSAKRKHELELKKRKADAKKTKSHVQLQQEKLKEGLETPLDASNKGFALLAKMGYKPGTSLGKQGDGIKEPVGISLKSDRIGLGWKDLLERKKREHEARKRKEVEVDVTSFRSQMSDLYNQKKITGDLARSREACHQLDYNEGTMEPPEYWFWPDSTWPEGDDESPFDINDLIDPSEQLQVLTSYLRTTHMYCVWCSTSFEDIADLYKECPGDTRQDHD